MMNVVGICAFFQSHDSDLGEDKLSDRGDGTMRKSFAAAVGSVVALVGFAGAANASATIDLIWAGTDPPTNQIGGFNDPLAPSANITLQVILHGSPAGALGSGVSVDYSGALPSLAVTDFKSTPKAPYLPGDLGTTINTGGRIVNLNAMALPSASLGIGLPPGLSAQLGTVTFHNTGSPTGTFEIRPDANSRTDGVLNSKGKNIAHTTRYNSAFVTVTGPNDVDGDAVDNASDNCSHHRNPGQDDTDADGCGNLCDADYDDSGIVGFPDFGQFVVAFGSADMEKCHNPPIPGCVVGFPDFGSFVTMFGSAPGPSGTTSGTTACP
jgi:hypothetical protein